MTANTLDVFGPATARGPASSRNSGITGWNPARRAPSVPAWERETTVARAREMVETDGYAAGAVAKKVDAIVGRNLRLKYKPNLRALGLTADEAKPFVDDVQALWEEYADDPRKYCDLTRHNTFGGLCALAFRHYLIESDAIAVIGWDDSRPFATTVRVVDPDLLSNPNNTADRADLRDGVEVDEDGAAVAYHFRGAHERSYFTDPRARKWTRIEREDDCGCPVVVHFFDVNRDGQTRGGSPFDAIIEALKMDVKLEKVELQAAVLDAVMAPYIKTASDIDIAADMFGDGKAAEYLEQRSEYYDNRVDVEVDGVRVHRLFPTDEMGVSESRRPAQGFADFSSAVLRRIASGLDISYEQLASDWSKTNYSSARAALNEIWRGWTQRRHDFVQSFCAPIFAAWFEEVITRGWIVLPEGAPDLHAAYASWTRVKGIGPGKGFVDPVKEVKAALERVAGGLSTMELETAELTGGDYHDNLAQLAREFAEMPAGFVHPALRERGDSVSVPDKDEDEDEDAVPPAGDRRPAARQHALSAKPGGRL